MKNVTLVGNLTRDPELRFTSAGKAVAEFGVAVNNRRQMANGEWEDGDTEFFDVTCWERTAENVAESLTKGQRVIVIGRMQYRTWEAEDGTKRNKISITADEVGHSLKWATSVATRNDRDDGAPATRTAPTPAKQGEWAYDEEPF